MWNKSHIYSQVLSEKTFFSEKPSMNLGITLLSKTAVSNRISKKWKKAIKQILEKKVLISVGAKKLESVLLVQSTVKQIFICWTIH